jgi:OOP family OmpA-OmpF porin
VPIVAGSDQEVANAAARLRGDESMRKMNSDRARVCFGAALVAISWSAPAGAQTLATPGMALNRFEPSERGSDWFANESLDLRGTARPALGVIGDYGYKAYVLRNPDGSENTGILVHQVYLHVGGALTLYDRLRIGVSLPIALVQHDGTPGKVTSKTAGGQTYISPTKGGAGDLRFAADLRLAGEYGDPFTIAFGGRLWLATGDETQYIGDGKVRIGPRVIVAGDAGAFAYSAGIGVVYRPNDAPFAGHPTGTELDFSAAAGLRVADKKLLIGPEVFGDTVLTQSDSILGEHTTPLALIVGGHYNAGDFRFGLGAGPGLSHTPGTALFRALASVEWMPAFRKAVPPPTDRDGDGVFDIDDACPDVAGPRTGDPKTNGCPPDRDGDGIVDTEDACPDVPGVKTSDPKTNGCPPDRDGDGIVDAEDACPDIPGPRDPNPKKNGCPLVRIEAGQVKILEQIKFKFDSAEIVDSQPIIEAVAKTLNEHPEIKHLRVEGHTDSVGTAVYNKDLSRRRAASVEKALVRAGVDRQRLSSDGFGLDKPIDDNSTAEGRAANRRVEFRIEDSATNPKSERK